jgi:hypothetical protein
MKTFLMMKDALVCSIRMPSALVAAMFQPSIMYGFERDPFPPLVPLAGVNPVFPTMDIVEWELKGAAFTG